MLEEFDEGADSVIVIVVLLLLGPIMSLLAALLEVLPQFPYQYRPDF